MQSRIADLLQRIAPPDYLFAPVAGRSYVDNAATHIGANAIRLLDIEDFFPSCSENKAIWFFHKRMLCSPDVAATLKGIVVKNGSLPQGSPCSPILAYLCYVDMWEEINRIVVHNGCKLSVYADDLTVSGRQIPERIIWEIKKVLRKHGHNYQKNKERKKYLKPAEITGVILRPNGVFVPNRQRKKLTEIRSMYKMEKDKKRALALLAQIRGREAQMQQVHSANEKASDKS